MGRQETAGVGATGRLVKVFQFGKFSNATKRKSFV